MKLININNILDGLINNCNILEYYFNNNFDTTIYNNDYSNTIDFSSINSNNSEYIQNLLLSFNFALYNFYAIYYSKNFELECMTNNKYILELDFNNLDNQDTPNLIKSHGKKIHSKYICAISSINDTTLSKKAMMYVHYKLKEDINLENVADFFHLNKIYFCSKFKEETGINFIIYVQEARVTKAKFLLTSEHLTVEEIAIECGFNSSAYFSRVFKKLEGISPTTFRKKNSCPVNYSS